MFKRTCLFIACVFGAMLMLFLFCKYIIWLSTLPEALMFTVAITTIGGVLTGTTIYCYLTREEYVSICYKVGDSKNASDVRVIAVCDNPFIRHNILEEGDCYRSVPLNTVLKEATWEDLNYKTKDGYMTVE